jgi:hypothetical protein
VKQRTVKLRTAERQRSRGIAELAVLVRFGDLVVAVAAQRVSRIVMADEVADAPGRATPSIRLGASVLPAWDLGALLGFSEPPAAWLVMTTSDEPNAATIALGTGPCMAVASHEDISALPPGVVSAPSAAILGVFATDVTLRDRGAGHLGLRVDPMHLIGASALAAAQRGEQ